MTQREFQVQIWGQSSRAYRVHSRHNTLREARKMQAKLKKHFRIRVKELHKQR